MLSDFFYIAIDEFLLYQVPTLCRSLVVSFSLFLQRLRVRSSQKRISVASTSYEQKQIHTDTYFQCYAFLSCVIKITVCPLLLITLRVNMASVIKLGQLLFKRIPSFYSIYLVTFQLP